MHNTCNYLAYNLMLIPRSRLAETQGCTTSYVFAGAQTSYRRRVTRQDTVNRTLACEADLFIPFVNLMPRGTVQTGASTAAQQHSILDGPPAYYKHRAATLECTVDVIGRNYPQLLDLVEQGVLFVHRRSAAYVERREDGYMEPELVFVIGTAHISRRSAEDVERVVKAVCPDSVVLELCKSRSGILQEEAGAEGVAEPSSASISQGNSNSSHDLGSISGESGRLSDLRSNSGSGVLEDSMTNTTGRNVKHSTALLRGQGLQLADTRQRNYTPFTLGSGDGLLPALARTMRLGGQSSLLLRLLLSLVYSQATAARAAEVTGSQLVLGDRPVEVTLGRAWDALTWQRRVELARDVLLGAFQRPVLTEQLVEELKSDNALSAMMQQLQGTYPELMRPFVTERDLYLAWSLKRSKAVNGNRAVEGGRFGTFNRGKGHLRGVAYALAHDSGELRFKDLVAHSGAKQGANRQRSLARQLVVDAVVAGVLWLGWRAVHNAGGGMGL